MLMKPNVNEMNCQTRTLLVDSVEKNRSAFIVWPNKVRLLWFG